MPVPLSHERERHSHAVERVHGRGMPNKTSDLIFPRDFTYIVYVLPFMHSCIVYFTSCIYITYIVYVLYLTSWFHIILPHAFLVLHRFRGIGTHCFDTVRGGEYLLRLRHNRACEDPCQREDSSRIDNIVPASRNHTKCCSVYRCAGHSFSMHLGSMPLVSMSTTFCASWFRLFRVWFWSCPTMPQHSMCIVSV